VRGKPVLEGEAYVSVPSRAAAAAALPPSVPPSVPPSGARAAE
jgi:hypothetical protein